MSAIDGVLGNRGNARAALFWFCEMGDGSLFRSQNPYRKRTAILFPEQAKLTRPWCCEARTSDNRCISCAVGRLFPEILEPLSLSVFPRKRLHRSHETNT